MNHATLNMPGARRRSGRSGSRALALILVAVLASVAPAMAEEPEYPHGEFEDDCEGCHRSEGWVPLRPDPTFDHGRAGFALDGAHQSAGCRACHRTLEFRRAPSLCADCHQDVHNSELGADCGRCHTTRSFIDRGRMRRAHLLTRFPLSGAHAAADCESCHTPVSAGNLVFVNRSTRCADCHLEDYRATTDPDHQAAGFSQTCDLCHVETTFARVRFGEGFDHAATSFALTGEHRRLDCRSCHVGGIYAGTSPDCASCHQQDYDQTTNPDHALSGFSTDCAACHRSSGWRPASFDHQDFFPIRSGPHSGRECTDCHLVPNDYSQFSCLDGCHEHGDQADVDRDHRGVSGYGNDSYNSQACYSCHPRGRH